MEHFWFMRVRRTPEFDYIVIVGFRADIEDLYHTIIQLFIQKK